MFKKYYEVLGVSMDADDATLRSAYRKQALKCHPDKHPEKAQAFLDLNEAYNMIQQHRELKQKFENTIPDPTSVFEGLIATLAQFFKNQQQAASSPTCKTTPSTSPIAEKAAPIVIECCVTLEEIYNKRVKKINIKVQRYDNDGKELSNASETVYICLHHYQPRHIFQDVGDDINHPLVARGDIYVDLVVKKHDIYRMSTVHAYDLNMTLDINLLQYYYGGTVQVPFLDGTMLDILIPICSDSTVIYNKGLSYYDENSNEYKRGNLYVLLQLVMPEKSIADDIGFKRALQSFYACDKA